jgi:hypothetical protein
MASAAYFEWLNAGKPYTLMRPAKQLQATQRARGFTVYDYPNTAHLQANTPEDHTPFSATGYPTTSPRWWAHAIDIMPKGSSTAAKQEMDDLARKIIADRDAGISLVQWIKYMNWTDKFGTTRQENWKSGTRKTYSSSDSGHIHISGFTGYETSTIGDGYDPQATATGGGVPDMDNAQGYQLHATAYRISAIQNGYLTVTIPAAYGFAAVTEDVVISTNIKKINTNVQAVLDKLENLETTPGAGATVQQISTLLNATKLLVTP